MLLEGASAYFRVNFVRLYGYGASLGVGGPFRALHLESLGQLRVPTKFVAFRINSFKFNKILNF
jgi:hypothetical protein